MATQSLRSVFAVLLALLGACEDSGEVLDAAGLTTDAGSQAPTAAICDASPSLRFAVRVFGMPDPLQPQMMARLGASYIYVMGDCTFWTNLHVGQWNVTYTGSLSTSQQERLAKDFAYGQWQDLNDRYTPPTGPSHGYTEFFDGDRRISCDGACEFPAGATGTPIDGFAESGRRWTNELQAQGQVVRDAVRVVVRRTLFATVADPFTAMLMIAWPYAWPLDPKIAEFDGAGIVVRGTEADDLRALREMYSAGGAVPAPNSFTQNGFFVFKIGDDLTREYDMWFRDVLPFEEQDGSVAFGVGE